jgi:hypothetical protein
VSATNSDAAIAIVTVSANGRSSPVMSPTNAIGRNTATVVMVEAVTAIATSRGAEDRGLLVGALRSAA